MVGKSPTKWGNYLVQISTCAPAPGPYARIPSVFSISPYNNGWDKICPSVVVWCTIAYAREAYNRENQEDEHNVDGTYML